MRYEITNIIDDIRIHIDEIGKNDSELVGGMDDIELDNIAVAKILQAVDYVRGNVALGSLDDCDVVHMDATLGNNDKYIAVSKPSDLLRFLKAHNSAWQNDVYDVLTAGSADAVMAADEYVGATLYNPCVILDRVGGAYVYLLHGRSANQSEETAYIEYVPIASIVENNKVDFGKRLYDAVVMYSCYLLLSTYNESARMKSVAEQVKSIMLNM